MDSQDIPPEINNVLAGESSDFIIKASRTVPLKKSLYLLGFGIFWLAFISIFGISFLGPLLKGEEVSFELNNVPTVAGSDNLGPLIFPTIFVGLFVLIGLGITGYGVYSLLSTGAWYIGTSRGLVIYQKNKTRTIDWEEFSGSIEVSGTQEKGSITLQMRTGQTNSHGKYVPDAVYLAGIQNAFQIEQMLRKRIKENDPTPSSKA